MSCNVKRCISISAQLCLLKDQSYMVMVYGVSPPKKKKDRRWKHVKIPDQQLATTEDDLNENPAVPQQGADGLSR